MVDCRMSPGCVSTSALLIITLMTLCMNCSILHTNAQNPCDVPCLIHDSNQSFSCENSGCTEFPLESIPATVKRIHLRNNSIRTIPLLDNLTQLYTLDLSDNAVNSLANSPFRLCENLQSLNLTKNNLTLIRSKFIKGLIALETISLKENKLIDIEENLFFHLRQLQFIDLSQNQINSLHYNSFTDLEQLDILVLSYNEIGNGTLHLQGTTLEVLMLDNNLIKSLDNHTFMGGEHLKILDLGSNLISDIKPKAFEDLDSLKTLNLSYNALSSIQTTVFDFRTLEDIYLDYNPLEELNAYVFPASARKFSCQHMPNLKVVRNGTFTNAKNLRSVYLNDNPELTTVEPGAFTGANSTVQGLDVSDSSLETLSKYLLNWSNLSDMELGGNRWNCDCNLLWMKYASFPQDSRSQIKCYTPFYLRGRSIASVSPGSLHCGIWRDPRVGVALTIIITVLFVAIATMVAYRYRRKVFPCYYKQTNYATLYNSDDTEDEAVTINWKQSEKTGLTESSLPPATQV